MNVSDVQLDNTITLLQDSIQVWAKRHDLWFDCGFQSYSERVDGDPGDMPVATIMWFHDTFGGMLDGDYHGLEQEFSDLLEQQGFWYERYDGVSAYIYPTEENPLYRPFLDYVNWQWICGLVKPDIADVHEEIYSYFANRPEDLHRLSWREFEILLFRIFQNQGFSCELGPGSNDGGVDVRLLQRDPLGDMLTLVQAKRYSNANKINLSAVAALHGVADVENAQQSIFVTTSSYLPSAKKFANRTRIPMKLATSRDVQEWCSQANNGIIQDKSKLIESSSVSSLIRSLVQNDPRIVDANTGVRTITNQFALVLKETKYAALLMSIPTQTISDDGYGQRGLVVPDLSERCIENLNSACVFRAKRSVNEGSVNYWNGHHLFSKWNGKPKTFDYCD